MTTPVFDQEDNLRREWDTEEYEPRHQHDRKLRDACYVGGMTILVLIACTGIYLAIEALRGGLGGLFVILLVPSVIFLAYFGAMLKLEDAWRDFKGWRERRKETDDSLHSD